MDSVWNKITSLKSDWNQLPHDEIYKEKMNNNYMIVCYWNLWEKFNCEGISAIDFEKIEKIYNTLIKERF